MCQGPAVEVAVGEGLIAIQRREARPDLEEEVSVMP